MRIALFGTSADPPTRGHLAILQWLVNHYDHVAVWAADNPLKANQIPLRHRMQMIQLLLSELANDRDRIAVYPNLSHPRTWITLDRARKSWPQAEFTLVVGADLVPQLPRWYQIGQILKTVRLAIVPRPGYRLLAEDLTRLSALGGQYTIAQITTPDISSTRFRQGIRTNGAIPALIQTYIEQENLYECRDVKRVKV